MEQKFNEYFHNNTSWSSARQTFTQYISLLNKRRLARFVGAFVLSIVGLAACIRAINSYPEQTKLQCYHPGGGWNKCDPLPSQVPGAPKYAFATLLSPNFKKNADQTDIASDEYFLSARLLNYQLRHSNHTKYNDPAVPFLVMCPPQVAENKRRILEEEGATIVPVEHVIADWIKIPLPTWTEMLDKLLLWSYTEYDKILFIDADVYLIQSLNGIFEDDAAAEFPTRKDLTPAEHLGALPATYTMAGIVDGGSGSRKNPMSVNYLNGGFFLIHPDQKLFQHLMKFVQTTDSFSTSMLEQNLINDIFSVDGPMPWQHMDPKWDTSCPEPDNIRAGWKTIHSKLWKTHAEPCDVDPVAGRMWYKTLGHMESFYAGQGPL
jgi:alpha-N-acetylglucosamine transferase